MRKSQGGYAGNTTAAEQQTDRSVNLPVHLFALLGQPCVQLGSRFFGYFRETEAGAASVINPGNLDFGFERVVSPGQLE